MRQPFWMAMVMTAFWLARIVSAGPLAATNVRGTDGTASMLNTGSPPAPLRIHNVQGLALTDPAPPGDNLVIGGANAGPDLQVMDVYFQRDATAGPRHGTGTPPASKESSVVLLEAQNNGTVGITTINWDVSAYKSYDGTGVLMPELSVAYQTEPEFAAGNVFVTISGDVTAGDKVILHNGGQTVWSVGAYADIDGDGNSTRTLNVEAEDFAAPFGADTNTSQDFNKATIRMVGWEIDRGQFVMGSFDVTFDMVTAAGTTWPGGDAFDVVPEPATLALMALGGLGLLRRKTRVVGDR